MPLAMRSASIATCTSALPSRSRARSESEIGGILIRIGNEEGTIPSDSGS
jgi:hypothetical protein